MEDTGDSYLGSGIFIKVETCSVTQEESTYQISGSYIEFQCAKNSYVIIVLIRTVEVVGGS